MGFFNNILSFGTKLFDAIKGITDRQKDIIDYRLSDKAIEKAKEEENREFNEALSDNDNRVSDAIRKKKQKQIKKLRNEESV